nr:MAG TPA: hypothetical protein [Crassvirales sp.]
MKVLQYIIIGATMRMISILQMVLLKSIHFSLFWRIKH